MVAELQVPQDQLAHWLEELSQYHMVIQHRPGRRHCNADALSRLPVLPGGCGTRLEVHPSDLPCGGCPKCKKAHESWSAFAEEVDDVGLCPSRAVGHTARIWGSARTLSCQRRLLLAKSLGSARLRSLRPLSPGVCFRGLPGFTLEIPPLIRENLEGTQNERRTAAVPELPRVNFSVMSESCSRFTRHAPLLIDHWPTARWKGTTTPSWTQCSALLPRQKTAQNCRDEHLAQIARALPSAVNRNIRQRGGTFSHPRRQDDPGESPDEGFPPPRGAGTPQGGSWVPPTIVPEHSGVLVPHTWL